MSDETKVTYGYDPLAKSGSDRWGHKGGEKHVPPDIPGYEFLDVLGSGAMGVVWSAKYKPLNQARAVKVISKAMAMDAKFLERFSEEAKMLARLEHPYIVKVYDASADPDCPYIAMDFVPGKTLNEVLRNEFPLPIEESIRYLEQAAEALDYAHNLGFVHRDIKPTNVMISNAGHAMLIDFGVARWVGELGQKGLAVGTTRYMSPEACRGERVTKSSDIWAFGVMIWRVLTGALPFDGKNEQQITHAILNNPPSSPKYSKRRVRAYLKQIMAKDPMARPTSAIEMVEGLRLAIWPLRVKADKEKLTVLSSVGVFGIVVAGFVGATIWYAATHVKPKSRVVYKILPGKAPTATPSGAVASKPAAGSVAPAASEISYMKGVWYANFGGEYDEIHVSPTTGRKFHAVLATRDQNGTGSAEADGEIGADNSVTYDETKPDASGGGKPAPLASFIGQISEDHARISGKNTDAGGQSTDGFWVRADDLPMVPYANAQGQFSVGNPSGWTTTDGTSFSPIGRPDVVFAVTIAPANGAQTVQDVFSAREKDLESAGGYENIGVNSSAPLGGREAVSWEFRQDIRHAILYGVLRGDNSVTVECWWPTTEDDVWAPVMESMRKHFTFTD